MIHSNGLILTLVGGFVLAFALGMLAFRLRLSPLVGYLAAGVIVGPFTPGWVADHSVANQLAEIGVILLMFGVGLHFAPKDLMDVRRVAVPGALLQIVLATGLGAALYQLLHVGLLEAALLGFRCRWPRRSWCCARSRSARRPSRRWAGSPSAGW